MTTSLLDIVSTSDVDRILAQIGVDLNPAATDGAAWTTLCEWRERVTAVLAAQRALAGAECATPKERLRAQRSDKREELGRLVRDVARLDWLQQEENRVDPVMKLAVKELYARSSSNWANVGGDIRKEIDAAMELG